MVGFSTLFTGRSTRREINTLVCVRACVLDAWIERVLWYSSPSARKSVLDGKSELAQQYTKSERGGATGLFSGNFFLWGDTIVQYVSHLHIV